MAKLKSFEEYIATNIDTAEEIEKDMIAMGEPETKGDGDEVESQEQKIGAEEVEDGTSGEDAGQSVEDMPTPLTKGEEDMKIDGKVVDTDPKDGSDDILNKMEDAEELEVEEVEEGNAFGDAVRKAKEAGETEFEFDGKTYKVEESLNEARIKAPKALAEIINGNTSRAEGIKMSKELADHYLTWLNSSAYGKKQGKDLPLNVVIKASFNWGIERGLDPKLKDELSKLKETIEESVSEGNAFGDAVRKAKEAGETEFEFDGKTYKVEESEETETTKEVKKTVDEMLKEAYNAIKNEAMVWEEDMHDDHTVESYLKENAALVASLAAKALTDMREDITLEAYEATCNTLKESYAKKMDEMKESYSAEGEEVKSEEE